MEIETQLKDVFHFQHFREGQKEAILALLAKQDLLVIFPTGGGKSLIYQLASILYPTGVSIVISPLISLMQDQVTYLKSLGIPAEYCNSTQDELDQKRALSRAVNGKIKLLYISPERATSSYFKHLLEQMQVNFVVVDEAHCISQWGHDFRPEYRKIHELRTISSLKSIPFASFTATATKKVKNDIINSLNLKNPTIIQTGYYRNNLEFEIFYFDTETEKESLLLDLISNFKQDGKIIIYCSTRKKTEEVQKILLTNGIKSGVYHAGKKNEVRESIQNSYTLGKYRILVATNAFGMGIDYPDVRMIIHYQTPASLEAYYQEAGRAGRDGKPARCILFCKESDFSIQSFLLRKQSNYKGMATLLSEMRAYTMSNLCRQVYLCNYFGQEISNCGKCDICKQQNLKKIQAYIDKQQQKSELKISKIRNLLPEQEEILFNCIRTYSKMYGKKIISKILRGSSSIEILRRKLNFSPHYGKLKHVSEESIQNAIDLAIESKKILISGNKYPKLYLPEIKEKKVLSKKDKFESTDIRKNLLKKLKNYRDYQAKKLKWKKFMVFQNIVLSRIAEQKPRTLEELSMVKGVGEIKLHQFGKDILEIIQNELVKNL